MKLVYICAYLCLGIMTKVDEKAQTHSGCFKVIDELRLVLGKQGFDSFQFENDFVVTDQICFVGLCKPFPFV